LAAVGFSETLVNSYKAARCRIPEDSNLVFEGVDRLKKERLFFLRVIQGDQKVSMHLMITIQLGSI
jgi:hypothetical protein